MRDVSTVSAGTVHLQQQIIMYNLSVHATNDPFPYAALVLAAYLKDIVHVTVDFDHEQGGCTLTRTADGTRIEENEAVVRALAKEAKAESNSTQVRYPYSVPLERTADDVR